MKKITTNNYALVQETKKIEELKEGLQKIVTDLSNNGINLPIEKLKDFCDNPEICILDELTKDMPSTFAGLPIKKDKVFDIAEKPTFVNSVVNYANENYLVNKISGYVDFFEIKDSKVTILKSAMEGLKEKYTSYAEGKKQIEALEKYQAVVDALNNLNDDISTSPYPGDKFTTLEQRIEFSSFEGKFVLIPNHIKSLS